MASMNKSELIEMKSENGLSKNEAASAANLFFEEMSAARSAGHRVEIRGLCSFYTKNYNPYNGRNPKTGEKVKVNRKKLPFFKPGKELKERVAYTTGLYR